MKTNFKNTYGQKLNTIRKDNVGQEGCLATTRHKKKQERTQMLWDYRKATYVNQNNHGQPWCCITHRHKEGAEHRQKAEQNRLPLKPAVWVFHHQQGVQVEVLQLGERFPGQKEGWWQEPPLCSATKEWHKKYRKNMTSRGMKHKTAIWWWESI